MSGWSTETHIFIPLWGELGPTLEDVVMLMLLPVFGDAQVANLNLAKRRAERGKMLDDFLVEDQVRCFEEIDLLVLDTNGKNNPYQLDAFLGYWLNYFVFPSPLEDRKHAFIFPMAISLPREGWFLGSLYAHFNECSRNITRSFGR